MMTGEPSRARTYDPLIKSAVKHTPAGYGSYDLPTFVTGCSRQRVYLLLLINPSLSVFWSQVGHKLFVPRDKLIARSDELPTERREWKLTQSLKRGEVYVWIVVAVIDGREIVSPGPAAPEMKFHVLSMRSLEQLNTLKKTRSHLALGVFYANAGLTADAQQEFRELVRLNPTSKLASNRLKAVSSKDCYQ
jgi:hypothetical protein